MDAGLFTGISARLVLGGGRGGRIRGASNRSLVVLVMGLGVEGRLGAASPVVGSAGPVWAENRPKCSPACTLEAHFSTGMPYKGLQVKLDSNPITRCDKAQFCAMLDMPSLIIRSLRDARKHEITPLLLASYLRQHCNRHP